MKSGDTDIVETVGADAVSGEGEIGLVGDCGVGSAGRDDEHPRIGPRMRTRLRLTPQERLEHQVARTGART